MGGWVGGWERGRVREGGTVYRGMRGRIVVGRVQWMDDRMYGDVHVERKFGDEGLFGNECMKGRVYDCLNEGMDCWVDQGSRFAAIIAAIYS